LHFAESESGAEPDTVAAAVIPSRAVAAVVDAATAAGGSVCVEFFTRPTATATDADADTDTETPAEPVATATEADTLAAGFVFFNAAGVNVGELWARTVEGRFPNWRAIFKTEYNEIGRVDVAGLASSASSARQLIKSAGDETNAIVISDGGGFVELVSPGWSRVSFLYSVAASTVPAFVPLTFDCRYLAELATAAARVSSDWLAFSVSESGAAHFETTGARVRLRGLIMPIVNKRPKPAAEAVTPAEAVATDADAVAAG
jgi:hypothetical protein